MKAARLIPNASVKIRNKGTGVERDTFSAPALPAAIYEVRVEVKVSVQSFAKQL